MHNGKIPVPYGSKLHIPPTVYHLLAAHQEPYKKSLASNGNYLSFLGNKSGEWTINRKMTIQKEQED